MMQFRAEMPKSAGQGVSLGLQGTKQVPAPDLLLLAAVWVTGQWEVLVKLAGPKVLEGASCQLALPLCAVPVLGVTFHPIEWF